MTVPLEPIQIVVACIAVAAGALVQGSIGFGMALLASPILAMVSYRLVPGPLMICGLAMALLTAARDWRGADVSSLVWILPGVIVGSGSGALVLSGIPVDTISVLLGALVLLAVAASGFGMDVAPSRRNLALAGFAAGFLSTTASIPGPPLALVYQRASGSKLRGTLAAIFLFTGSVSLFNLHLIGRFGAAELPLAMMLGPAAVAGFGLSWFTADRLDPATFRVAVLVLAALAGVAAILRGLA